MLQKWEFKSTPLTTLMRCASTFVENVQFNIVYSFAMLNCAQSAQVVIHERSAKFRFQLIRESALRCEVNATELYGVFCFHVAELRQPRL